MPRPRQITPKQLAEAAYRFFVLGHKQSQIASDLLPGHRSGQGIVSRWLKDAEAERIVQYDIDADAALTGVPIKPDETKMVDRFRALSNAHVIDVRRLRSDYKAEEWDSTLHIALANHAGAVSHGALSVPHQRRNLHIAIAGGRTCVRLARVLARTAPGLSEILVTPLGGHIWSGRLWETGAKHTFQLPLNPDYAAVILASELNAAGHTKVRFSQIGRELYAGSEDEARKIIEDRCVFQRAGTWFGGESCDHAFVGVGCLAQSTHRYAEILRDDTAGQSPNNEKMAGIRKTLVDNGLPQPGDIANRFLLALPRPEFFTVERDLPSLEALYGRLSAEVDAVNACSVVMDWGHLKTSGCVWVIAGGPFKIDVLFTLLLYGETRPEGEKARLVSRLVTDTESADQLGKWKEAYDGLSSDIRGWYARLCSRLFSSPG
jgi:hypothetical protein